MTLVSRTTAVVLLRILSDLKTTEVDDGTGGDNWSYKWSKLQSNRHQRINLQAGCLSCCPTNNVTALKGKFQDSCSAKHYQRRFKLLHKIKLVSIAQFAITINSNVCPHIRVPNMLMRESCA